MSQGNDLLAEIDKFLTTRKDTSLEASLILDKSSRSRSRSRDRNRSSKSQSRSKSRDRSSKREKDKSYRERSRSREGRSRGKVHFDPYAEDKVYNYSPVSSNQHHHSPKPSSKSAKMNSKEVQDSFIISKKKHLPKQQIKRHQSESSEDISDNEDEELYSEESQPPIIKKRSKSKYSIHTDPNTSNVNNKSLHVSELMSPDVLQQRRSSSKKKRHSRPIYHYSDEEEDEDDKENASPVNSPDFSIQSLRLSPVSYGFQEQVEMMKQRIRRLIEINNNMSADLHSQSSLNISSSNESLDALTPNIRSISKIVDQDTPIATSRHLHQL
jgi:hypothetical protein